jgi:hypothetical protein
LFCTNESLLALFPFFNTTFVDRKEIMSPNQIQTSASSVKHHSFYEDPNKFLFKIRPLKAVTGEGELEMGASHGLGVLQKQDLAQAMQSVAHPHFLRHHFNEHRLQKWADSTMFVYEVHDISKNQELVRGTFITDDKMHLIAYCVENSVPRMARGNKDKMVSAIKEICEPKSTVGKI